MYLMYMKTTHFAEQQLHESNPIVLLFVGAEPSYIYSIFSHSSWASCRFYRIMAINGHCMQYLCILFVPSTDAFHGCKYFNIILLKSFTILERLSIALCIAIYVLSYVTFSGSQVLRFLLCINKHVSPVLYGVVRTYIWDHLGKRPVVI